MLSSDVDEGVDLLEEVNDHSFHLLVLVISSEVTRSSEGISVACIKVHVFTQMVTIATIV